ncbi:hypothetical protein [Qipengyuania marisflavi]|uniref:Autotransporter domain-containing protein n=1 Tax=Qipengyuania marisflavi TaxID=2486356 RepID=A0A5S3P9Y6_9SPHN|nr:hypothetical protein [Qipengyuania marisflavi]TMM50342.1 hypothetical protein FEV51_03980 [Qipengyuania marisflavi]
MSGRKATTAALPMPAHHINSLHQTPRAHRTRRQRLMMQGSVLALSTTMIAFGASEASAQSVAPRENGTRSVQADSDLTPARGTHTTSPVSDVVTVLNQETIINWTTLDTLSLDDTLDYVNFLPNGTNLTFVGPAADYVVLNRIFTAPSATGDYRGIAFGGNVSSRIGATDGSIGGNIWFYSPGGILVNSTASFNVGSLLLSTSNIETIGAGGNQVNFLGITDPGSSIIIQGGARVLANAVEGSYVAMFAPRIEQGGTIDVNGSALLAAAEQGTLTINAGLLSLAVDVGSEDANGIVHTGTTGGPASTGGGDVHWTQLVAVPKNQVMTMLVGGTLGYAEATSAGVVNGTVVLGTGAPTGTGTGNVDVGPAQFNSSTFISSSNDVLFSAAGTTEQITIGGATNTADLTIQAANQIDFEAINGGNIFAFGSVSLGAGSGAVGGTINITADDVGRDDDAIINGIVVGENFTASTARLGVNDSSAGGIGGNATGGTINVDINTGGDFLVGGNVNLSAFARAGFGEAQAGNATGGSVNFAVTGINSRAQVTGTLAIDTSADAAINPDSVGALYAAVGGDAVGGAASFFVTDGRTNLGELLIDSSATASRGTDASTAQSNDAVAGDVAVRLNGNTQTIGSISVAANSSAVASFDAAGNAIAGAVGRSLVDLIADGSTVNIAGGINIDATTFGDVSAAAPGNVIRVATLNDGTVTAESLALNSSHTNGMSANGGTTGSVGIVTSSGGLDVGAVSIDTRATLGFGATEWHDLTGGNITALAIGGFINGTTLSAQSGVYNNEGLTGQGASIGGNITLLADAGNFVFSGSGTLDSSVDGGTGGDQTGLVSRAGDITITQRGDAAGISFNGLDILANAAVTGGFAEGANFIGDGGNAQGGTILIDLLDEDTVTADLSVQANGTGGQGGSIAATAGAATGTGGTGAGGSITLNVGGRSLTTSGASLEAIGTGGAGGEGYETSNAGSAGAGGLGRGGSILVNATNGDISSTGSFAINAFGQGGAGGSGYGVSAGRGGNSQGGNASFVLDGANLLIASGALEINAYAAGGAGGNSQADFGEFRAEGEAGGDGGDAFGGTATYRDISGSTDVTVVALDTTATGGNGGQHIPLEFDYAGDGGAGGSGTGGSTNVILSRSDASSIGYALDARGTGGEGSLGIVSGAGGDGIGGNASLAVENAAVIIGNSSLLASGAGGNARDSQGDGADGAAGGRGTGGSASITADGAVTQLSSSSAVNLGADGTGGVGGRGGSSNDAAGSGGFGGAGGLGTGGTIALSADNGATLAYTAGSSVNARGFGGAGGAGGDNFSNIGGMGGAGGGAVGGSIAFSASTGSTITVQSFEGDNQLNANAIGSTGGDGGLGTFESSFTPGSNGFAIGGDIALLSTGDGSDLTFTGNLIADASAVGAQDTRADASGADATGGSITAEAALGAAFTVTGGFWADATTLAAIGEAGAGTGTGGSIDLVMSGAGSSFDLLGQFDNSFPLGPRGNSLYANASAYEPQSGVPEIRTLVGGDTIGGTITLDFADGSSSFAANTGLVADAGASNPSSAPGQDPALFINPASATGGTIAINLTNSINVWNGNVRAAVNAFAFGGQATLGQITGVLNNAVLDLGANSLSMRTYTAGEIAIVDPVAIDLQVLNGSTLSAGSVSLFADAGHGISTNTIQTGDISMLVDNSAVNVLTGGISIGTEAQAFRFPSVATNTTGADAVAGDVTFVAQNGSVISGNVQLQSFATSDSGPSGGDSTSGTLTYVLADSTHTGGAFGAALEMFSLADGLGGQDIGGSGGRALAGDMNVTISGAANFTGDMAFSNSLLTSYNGGNSGALGAAEAGDVTIDILGGSVNVGTLDFTTSMGADIGGPATAGSDQFGGDFNLTVSGGDFSAASTAIFGDMFGGEGGEAADRAGGTPGAGGAAVSGNVTVTNAGTGALALGDFTVSNSAFGGQGGAGSTGPGGFTGGAGGLAFGGTTTLTGLIDYSALSVTSQSTGGDGGAADLGGTGGRGGTAFGGNLTIDSPGALTNTISLVFSGAAVGGAGADGDSGGTGGAGGAGLGGDFTIALTGTGDLAPVLETLTADTTGTGGAAGAGGSGTAAVSGGAGGTGGAGTAGDVTFTISGAGAVFNTIGMNFNLDASALGGVGGTGGANLLGGTSGNGGLGGNATGGNYSVNVNDGALLDISAAEETFQSVGQGGDGGAGGALDLTNGGTAGGGGNGGDGTGLQVRVTKNGGDLVAGDLTLLSLGVGGNGGAGGTDGGALSGTAGNGGAGTGDIVLLANAFTIGGSTTANDFVMRSQGIGGSGALAGASTAGSVIYQSTVANPANVLDFASLTLEALGDDGTGVVVFGPNSTPTTVSGNADFTSSDDLFFVPDGGAQLVVGGSVFLSASNDIVMSHSNAPSAGFLSLDVGGSFFAAAGGNFSADLGTIVQAGDLLSIRAEGNLDADDLRAGDSIDLSAGQNLTVTDLTITGPVRTFPLSGGVAVANGIRLEAGNTEIAIGLYDPTAQLTINGNVTSTGDITMTSGGQAIIAGGADVSSDNGISIITGDDIILGAGATLTAAANPANSPDTANPFTGSGNLVLAAGLLVETGRMEAPLTTPISSIVLDGTINSNAFSTIMTANAIDGLDSTITAASLTADINDAPAAGAPQSNDAGLLSANCLEGSICLGSVAVDNQFQIGQASNNDVIQLIVEQPNLAANRILITTRNDIVMGTSGFPTTLTANDQFLLASTSGNVNLFDATVTSNQIDISAAGSLLGTGSLISPNDIGITVGQDINLALLDTGGQLTNVGDTGGPFETAYAVPGSLDIGTYIQRGATGVRITAGGDISFGEIQTNGARTIALLADAGDVFLGAVTPANQITLAGDNVMFGDLSTVSQGIDITADNGDVAGGSLDSAQLLSVSGNAVNVGDLSSGAAMDITALAGDLTAGAVSSGAAATLDASGNVTTGDISAAGLGLQVSAGGYIAVGTVSTTGAVASIGINAGGAVDFTSVTSSSLLTITGTDITGGDVQGDDQTEVTGETVAIGNVTSANGFVIVESTVGDVSAGDITSDTLGVTVTSAGAANLGNLTGSNVNVTTAGDATLADTLARANLTFEIGGNLVSGALVSQSASPGLSVTVGGDADVTSASSNGLFDFTVGGALTGGDFFGGNQTNVDAGSVNLTSLVSGGAITVAANAGDVTIGTLDANGNLRVDAAGQAIIGQSDSLFATRIFASSIDLGGANSGGLMLLDAATGAVTVTGTLDAGASLTINAATTVTLGDAAAGAGFALTAADDVTFGTITATDGDAQVTSTGGSVSGTSLLAIAPIGSAGTDRAIIDAAGDITLTGMAQSVDDGVFLTAGGAISVNDIQARDQIRATAGTGAVTIGTITQDLAGFDTILRGSAVSLNSGTLGGSLVMDALAGNVAISGTVTVGEVIDLDATGGISIGTLAAQGGDFTADAGGAITYGAASATGDLAFTAGGAITGGDLDAGGALTLNGADIVIGAASADAIAITGNALTSDLLDAGATILVDASGDVSIANLLSGGQTDITGASVQLGGGDIGGALAVTATAGALTQTGRIDIAGAASFNADAGDIVLGTVVADDTLQVLASGNIDAFALTGAQAGTGDLIVDAGGAVTVDRAFMYNSGGTARIAGSSVSLTTGRFSGRLTMTARTGDITSGGVITADQTASFIASGDVALTGVDAVGGIAIDAGANATYDELISDRGDVTIATAGDVTGRRAIVGVAGADASLLIDAGGTATLTGLHRGRSGVSITADTIDAADVRSAQGDIEITANGLASIGNVTTPVGLATITGASVVLDQATFSSGLSVTATAGDITGTGNLNGNLAAGYAALSATGDIAIGSVSNDGAITLDAGGSASFAELYSRDGSIAVNAGGDITGSTVVADDSFGTGGIDSVTLTAGGDVTLDQTITVFNGYSGAADDFTINAGGAVSLVTIDAVGAFAVDAAGTVAVDSFSSGASTTISGSDVSVGSGAVGGDLALTVTAGDLDATGALTVGGGIDLDASGAIAIGTLAAQGGDFTADAGGAITYDAASATGDLAFTAGGAITGGDLDAGGALTLSGADIAIGAASADAIAITGDALTSDLLDAGTTVVVDASGDVTVIAVQSGDQTDISGNVVDLGSFTTGAATSIAGASVSIGSGTSGGDLTIDASAGDVVLGGAVTSAGGMTIGAAGSLQAATLDAQGGALSILADNVSLDTGSGANGVLVQANGDIAFGSLTSDNRNVELTAGGSISGDTAIARAVSGDGGFDRVIMDAGGDITMSGVVQSVFDGVFLTAGGAIDLADVRSSDRIQIAAGGTLDIAALVQSDGGFATTLSGSFVTLGDVQTGGSATIDAGLGLLIGTASIGNGLVANSAGDVTFTSIETSNDDAEINAAGSISGGDIAALAVSGEGGLDRVILSAGGDIAISGTVLSATDGVFATAGGDFAAGTVDAQDTVSIDVGGAVTIDDVFQRVAGSDATISGASIALGRATIASSFTATANSGDIAVSGPLSVGGTAVIDAANDVSLASASAAGLDVTAGGAIGFGSLISDLQIALTADGAINGGTLDAATTLTASAGSTLDITTATAGGAASLDAQAITYNAIIAGGPVTLAARSGGITGTESGDITSGGAIGLSAAGDILVGTLAAQGGDISADADGAIAYNAALATGDLAFTAGGAIAGGDLDAGGALTLSGADIAIGAASADTIAITTGADILFDSLTANAAITLAATIGTIGANAGPGDITSGGDVTLDAQVLALGDVSSGGSLNATSSVGDASFGAVDAAADITVSAAGGASLTSAISGGNTSLTGTTISLASGDIGGDLALDATAGDLDATGALTVGGGIDLDASGAIAIGTLAAQGGDFTADAGSAITYDAASATGDLAFTAGGAITGGDLDAGGALTLSGADIAIGAASADAIAITTGADILFDSLTANAAINLAATNGTIGANAGPGDITSGGDVTLTAQDIALGDIAAGGAISAAATSGDADFASLTASSDIAVVAAGTPTIGALSSGGDTSITGASVTLSQGDVGGDLSLTSTTGDVDARGTVTAGGAITLSSAGAVQFDTLNAAGGDLTANAAGDIDFAAANAAGSVTLASSGGALNGGNVTAGSAIALSGTAISLGDLDAGTALTADAFGGDLAIGDASAGAAGIDLTASGGVSSGDLAASGPIAVDAGSTLVLGNVTGGAIALTAGGAIGVGIVSSTDDLTISGSEIAVTSANAAGDTSLLARSGAVTADAATAGGRLSVTAQGAIMLGDAVGDNIALTATNGALTITNDLRSTAAGPVDVTLSGTSIAITDSNGVRISSAEATGGTLAILAADTIVIGSGQAADNVSLNSSGGSVLAGTIVAGADAGPSSEVDGSITISAAQDATGALTAASRIGVTAGGDITLGQSTAGTSITLDSGADTVIAGAVAAGTDIAANAGGVFDIIGANSSLVAGLALDIVAQERFLTEGLASGERIVITSGDVVITDSGQLGDASRTQSIVLSNLGAPVTLGGDGSAAGYVVDASEFARIFSGGDVAISATGGVTVDSFTVSVGGQERSGTIGSAGSFTIDSQASIDVIGALDLTNAGAENTLGLRAADTIRVQETGNLRVTDADDTLTGLIALEAANIAMGSDAALGDFEGSSMADLGTALGTPTNVTSVAGFIQADTINFTVSDRLLIQNTGASSEFADRRGFTANTVNITADDDGQINGIAINGTIGGVTGLDAIELANIAGDFDADSTINGCLIGNPASCIPVIPPPPPPIDPVFGTPIQDLLEENIREDNDEALGVDPVGTMLVMLDDPTTDEDDPLIDDPVTGAGNDDLWNGTQDEECDQDDEDPCPVETPEEELEPAE